jgi:hypothetical protein
MRGSARDGDGIEELNSATVRQIVRLANLPSLRRLSMICRMPSFVWANNLNLEHVEVKGLLGDTDVEGERRCWGELEGAIEGADAPVDAAAPRAKTDLTLEVVEDVPGGMLAMVNDVEESLSRVTVASFSVRFPGKGRHRAVEHWLYKFLELSRHSLKHLELSIEELPKMRMFSFLVRNCVYRILTHPR